MQGLLTQGGDTAHALSQRNLGHACSLLFLSILSRHHDSAMRYVK